MRLLAEREIKKEGLFSFLDLKNGLVHSRLIIQIVFAGNANQHLINPKSLLPSCVLIGFPIINLFGGISGLESSSVMSEFFRGIAHDLKLENSC